MKKLLEYIRRHQVDKLIDYSQSDFLEWNREREKHLQMIEMLKDENAKLKVSLDYWRNVSRASARRNKS